MIKTAVIIAGGEGVRLKPLTEGLPKAMAPMHGHPMLYWVVKWLRANGIEHLVIGVAYQKEKIVDYLYTHGNFGLKIDISEHTLEGGTAQGFGLAISRYVKDPTFLAMNCDEITNLSVANMEEVHGRQHPMMTMALAPFHCRFSTVDVDTSGKVSGFCYGHLLNNVLVSIGIYIFELRLLDRIPATGSIEDLVFTNLAQDGQVAAYPLIDHEEWISVNDIKDLRAAEKKLTTFYGDKEHQTG